MLGLGFKETLLLSFLVLFPTFTLLAWREKAEQKLHFSKRLKSAIEAIILVSFFASLSSTVFTMVTGVRTSILSFTMPFLIGSLVVSLGFKDPPYRLIVPLALALTPMIISSALSVHGYFPIGQDEGYHTAYAVKIFQEGSWVPGRYPIHEYYQWFPVISGVKGIIGLVTGMGILRQVHSSLVILVSIAFPLLTYLSLSRILESRRVGVLGVILTSSIPLFSTLEIIPQTFAYLIFMMFLFAFSFYLWKRGRRRACFIAILLLFAVGIITHPTFFVTAASTLFAALFAAVIFRGISSPKYRNVFLILVVVSLAYWTHLYILDAVLAPLKNGLVRLYDILFAGEMYVTPVAHHFSPVTPAYLAYSWALLPALSFSFLATQLKKFWRGCREKISVFSFVLTGIGIGFMGFVFLDASVTGLGIGRYFFAGILISLIGASFQLKRIVSSCRGNKLVVSLIAIIIAISAFSAMHSPAYSPDIHPQVVPLTSSRPEDWRVMETLAEKIPPDSLDRSRTPSLGVPEDFFSKKGLESGKFSENEPYYSVARGKSPKIDLLIYSAYRYEILKKY